MSPLPIIAQFLLAAFQAIAIPLLPATVTFGGGVRKSPYPLFPDVPGAVF